MKVILLNSLIINKNKKLSNLIMKIEYVIKPLLSMIDSYMIVSMIDSQTTFINVAYEYDCDQEGWNAPDYIGCDRFMRDRFMIGLVCTRKMATSKDI